MTCEVETRRTILLYFDLLMIANIRAHSPTYSNYTLQDQRLC